MPHYKNIVVLTGAGLSAESGLGTFRDEDGIWTKYDLNEVATPEGFAANPEKVHDFYNARRAGVKDAEPNAAHIALAKLEAAYPGKTLMVTQNIDALLEHAGAKKIIHMHGELLKALCTTCGGSYPWLGDMSTRSQCEECYDNGSVRPDVVWFGEMPYQMESIMDALEACDLFISIGTSGTVYPAAGFVAEARDAGAHTVELNLEPSEGASLFHEQINGPATEIVPQYVAKLLAV